jgi:hypothetical protein
MYNVFNEILIDNPENNLEAHIIIFIIVADTESFDHIEAEVPKILISHNRCLTFYNSFPTYTELQYTCYKHMCSSHIVLQMIKQQ